MDRWVADLHVHTLLSPCAEIEMTPRHIVMQAAANGVNLVAITDHNVCGNVLPAIRVGQELGVVVWAGVEVETMEGGHVVVLFDSLKKLLKFQEVLDKNMPDMQNNAEKFGGQFIVDENDEFIKEETRMLLASVKLDVDALIALADSLGGVCIAAHVDKPAYSLLSYLGFIQADSGFVAVEISRNSLKELTEKKMAKLLGNLPYITNSDAHMINDFLTGPKNYIYMKQPTIEEFKLALKGLDGRKIEAGKKIG